MAKKKKSIERPKHKPTRRQLSRWQKQKRRQRIIIGVGVAVILAALGLIIAGVNDCYVKENKPLKESAIEINGVVFDMGYYIDFLTYLLGDRYEYAEYYTDYAIELIKYNELVRQEAAELGVTVSDEEVKEYIETNEMSDSKVVRDMVRAELTVNKVKEEYFYPQVPESADQKHIMAMFLESESQVEEVKQRLLDGEDFGEIAAEMSLEDYTKQESGDLGWRPEGIINGLLNTSILEDFIQGYPLDTLSLTIEDAGKNKELGYWLAMVLEMDDETGEARVQAILLPSQEEAINIKARLDEGEDFNQLAEEFSQAWSEQDGASLGWIAEGDVSSAFDEFAFNEETELNVVSQPIRDENKQTSGGYWLFKVLESDYREISEEDRETLVNQMLQEWLLEIQEDPENEEIIYIDETMKQFAINKIKGQ